MFLTGLSRNLARIFLIRNGDKGRGSFKVSPSEQELKK